MPASPIVLAHPVYNQNPVNYKFVVGLTSILVLPFNALRERVIFHNPHATASIALSCLVDQNNNPLPAVMNGAGSIIMLPLMTFDLTNHPVSGWNAISDTIGASFTILDFF